MNFYALDIETSSSDIEHPEYALQPWRKDFQVDLIAIGINEKLVTLSDMSDTHSLTYWHEWLAGRYVWTWNGIFDITGLISRGIDCSKIRWLDAMSAAKWILRSQATDPPDRKNKYSWALANVTKDHLKEWQCYEEFLSLKANLRTDAAYWRRRCELDVAATLKLGSWFWSQMTEQQRVSFVIEQEALYPTAKAWMEGCHYDFNAAGELFFGLNAEKAALLTEIGRYL